MSGSVGSQNTFTYTIIDDDNVPQLGFIDQDGNYTGLATIHEGYWPDSECYGECDRNPFRITNLGDDQVGEPVTLYWYISDFGDTENSGSTNIDHLQTSGIITLDEYDQSWYFVNQNNETYASGTVSGQQSYYALDDNQDEPTESFTITISMVDPAGAAATDDDATVSGSRNTITASITDHDSDSPPDVYFQASSSPGEVESTDASTNTVTVTLLLATESGFDSPSIQYTVSGTAGTNDPNVADDSDHNLDAGTLTFDAFATSKTFDVTIANDVYDEDDDETIIITLTSGTESNLTFKSFLYKFRSLFTGRPLFSRFIARC